MNRVAPPDPDREFEETLGRLLGVGILVSTACLAAGLALAAPAAAVSASLLTAGLVLLMATPIARVLVSVIAYARRHDWLFALLTLIVLLELAASVAAALHAR